MCVNAHQPALAHKIVKAEEVKRKGGPGGMMVVTTLLVPLSSIRHRDSFPGGYR